MSEAPLWILWRRKYLRPIYGPIYDKTIIEIYRLIYKREVKNVAMNLDTQSKIKRNLNISLVYNHEFHPPTYGDYFIVVMIARFLSLSGHKVNLIIKDTVRVGAVWNALNLNEQDSFVKDQISLAKKLLNKNCELILIDKNKTNLNIIDKVSADIQIDSKFFINWCPHLIHLLIKKYKWPIPTEFLLKGAKKLDDEKYLTWNVRKSIWAIHRDTSEESLIEDFKEIRTHFPSYSIIILSNKIGIDFAFKTLFGTKSPKIISWETIRVIPQPNDGFSGAIETILDSSFYFQRNGGGMALVPIFSEIPYLIFPIEKTNFLGHKKSRIAPWASSDQIFKKVPLRSQPKKISEFINL
jgi:hypothetical protein